MAAPVTIATLPSREPAAICAAPSFLGRALAAAGGRGRPIQIEVNSKHYTLAMVGASHA
jgi:hypothetical protein